MKLYMYMYNKIISILQCGISIGRERVSLGQ